MIFVNDDLDQHFQKCFTYYDTGTWALQNVRRDRGLLHNFVFVDMTFLLPATKNVRIIGEIQTFL